MAPRIILITGANSGVGFGTAKVLASASNDFHVIMAGRSLEKLKNAKSEIETAGIKGSLSIVQLDVTDENSIQQAVKHVKVDHGRLDALINNAAVGGNRVPDIKTRMQQCMDTNVIGAAVVAAAFRPLLLAAQNPYSIWVSSGAGSLTRASGPKSPHSLGNEDAYRASKAALNMIGVLEARDFGPQGLKVFIMSPGFVISNLRGPSEEERSGWGGAEDPQKPGKFMLSILQGDRDADVGKYIHIDRGFDPW